MSIDNLDIHYRLLKILEGNPNLTERWMAKEMGLSLGKFNHCLKELVKKDFVKVKRFISSDNRAAYIYPLTPHGIEEKSKVTAKFLKRKMIEFETNKQQIEELQQEARGENRYTD